MTQVALREDTNHGVSLAVPDAVRSLAEWAQQLDAAMRIAKALCNTSFVPKHFQGKPEEAAAAILAGHEFGLGPMASLRIFYVIGGRPEMYAEGKVAILTAHGHRVWTDARSDESVTVSGRRKGEERVETITITMDQAKRAGWANTNANYTKTPQDMLYARAASRVCRLVAPELLHGIATVGDPEEAPLQVTATVGRVSAAEILGVQDAAVVPEATTPEPQEATEPTSGGITPKQQKMMHALLNQRGKGDRDVGLVFIAGVIGREIASTKELTKDEAGLVIDVLDTEEDPEPTLDVDEPDGP